MARRGDAAQGGRMARRQPYEMSPEQQAMQAYMAPIERGAFERLTDDQIGAEVQRLWSLKRAEMAPRIALDMRLLKWYAPEKLQDTWSRLYPLPHGKVIAKLNHDNGLAAENIPWSSAIGEALVGLFTGNKPMAYRYEIEPEDPATDADILQADAQEKILDRWVRDEDYELTYLDHATNVVMLGRSWKYVYTDPDTLETCAEVIWPGHVGAFFQPGGRRVEQAIVLSQLDLDTALRLYGQTPEREAAIRGAITRVAQKGWTGSGTQEDRNQNHATVNVLTMWYRLGESRRGDGIGMCVVLEHNYQDSMGNAASQAFTLFRDDDTGYEDVPLHCTPRFKIANADVTESYGVLMQIAGLHTQYNEVFSAFRDMLWRTIYARYVAKGFYFRNAPKLIPGSAIYALPRTDQSFEKMREEVNTLPIEQFLTHLEELIIAMPGLNKYFLGVAPPSETSGEAINAAIHASIARVEPIRTNIQAGEEWTFEQVFAQQEAFYQIRYGGRTVTAAAIIEGKRHVGINWLDVAPKDAEKERRMMLEGMNAKVVARDSVQDSFGVHSKSDENRKIRKESRDVEMSPERVAAIANAMAQKARAEAMVAQIQQQAQMGPLASMLGGGGAPGGPAQPPAAGTMQARSDNLNAVEGARKAPALDESANTSQGPGTAGGRFARQNAKPPAGQRPSPRR